MKQIIEILKENNQTVATMESCTGGAVASAITNNPGASEILRFSAVTYSNEFKIKMGVDPEIIDKYSVYSIETAISMSESIADFAESNFGIGITGKINTPDPANNFGEDDIIYISIYDAYANTHYNYKIDAIKNAPRLTNKEYVISIIEEHFLNILNNNETSGELVNIRQ